MIKFILIVLFAQSALCKNLVDVLNEQGLTTLVSLIQHAGLTSSLLAGNFTVCAPSNAAFAKLPQDTLVFLPGNTAALAEVLKYHVVPGFVIKAAASDELELPTLEGRKIRFNIYSQNNVVTVEGASVSTFDRLATNGVVHVLDSVIIPPASDIVTQLSDHSEFQTLVAKVKATGLVQALQANGLTVFAPTDAAFAKLGSDTLSRLASNDTLLKEILLYHVVSRTEFSAGLYDKQLITTLDVQRDTIKVGFTGSNVYLNGYSRVTEADVTATNGVIHVIDHVIVPDRYYFSVILG